MTNIYSKLGSSFYVLWGALHIVVANKVFTLAQGVDAGIVQGRIFQDAWSLLFFAVFAIILMLFSGIQLIAHKSWETQSKTILIENQEQTQERTRDEEIMGLRHKEKPHRILTVPNHKELAKGTLRALIRHAGLTVDEFSDLI